MYAMSTGLLAKPFISLYQHRQPQDLPRLLDAYLKSSERRRHSTKSPFDKQIRGKRFFEFSPLAFERKTYRNSRNKPFRIFDVKRFFQYSPFIARLQRSHVKPKLESPKPNFRPYVKPLVDHFSGSQRWAPLSKSTSNNRPSSPISSWHDNQNQLRDSLENKENFHETDMSPESHDTNFDNTKQSIVNDKSYNGLMNAVKIDSGPSDIIALSNDDVYSNQDIGNVKISTILNDWRSTAEPKQNINSNFFQLDTPDKLKNEMEETVNRAQVNDDQNSGKYILQDNDHFNSNSQPDTFLSEHTLTNKPSHFGFQDDIAQTKDTQPFGWSAGFGPVDSFGSAKNSDTIPNSPGGFSNVIYDTPVLHSKPSPGVWGSFVEDTARPEPTFDAIPVPPLPSRVDTNVSCFHLTFSYQNSSTSAIFCIAAVKTN